MRVDVRRWVEPGKPLAPGTGLVFSNARNHLLRRRRTGGAAGSLLPPFMFEKAFGSCSQPLMRRLARTPALAEAFAADWLLPAALAGTATVGIAVLVARDRLRLGAVQTIGLEWREAIRLVVPRLAADVVAGRVTVETGWSGKEHPTPA